MVGHSQGEIAAAHVAGALSLEDAASWSPPCAPGDGQVAGKGGDGLGLDRRRASCERADRAATASRLALAAINGPASTGPLRRARGPRRAARRTARQEGLRAQAIAVDYASHSAQVEDLSEELLEAFAPISPQSAQVPFHSTVTGEPIDTASSTPPTGIATCARPSSSSRSLAALLKQGHRALIEVSPHPVFAFGLEETIEAHPHGAQPGQRCSRTLRREEGGPERFALSLAAAHAARRRGRLGGLLRGHRRQGGGAADLPLPAPALLAGRRHRRRGRRRDRPQRPRAPAAGGRDRATRRGGPVLHRPPLPEPTPGSPTTPSPAPSLLPGTAFVELAPAGRAQRSAPRASRS